MKAVVAAFNQEKALVGAFSVITNLRMDFFQALIEEEQEVTTVGAVEPATTTQTPAQTATTDGPQVEFINRNASNDLAKSDGIVSFL